MIPIEDIIASQQVVNGYSFYYDRRDYESLIDLFAPEATLDVLPRVDVPGYPLPTQGRENVVEALKSRGDYFDIVQRRHVAVTHFVSEWEPTRLRSHAYMMVIHTPAGGSPEMVQVGEYEDVMVKSADGVWQIAERLVHKDRRGPVIDSMDRNE